VGEGVCLEVTIKGTVTRVYLMMLPVTQTMQMSHYSISYFTGLFLGTKIDKTGRHLIACPVNMLSTREPQNQHSYLIFQSVSRANTVNMNGPPLPEGLPYKLKTILISTSTVTP
jgi:hypothetical protein